MYLVTADNLGSCVAVVSEMDALVNEAEKLDQQIGHLELFLVYR